MIDWKNFQTYHLWIRGGPWTQSNAWTCHGENDVYLQDSPHVFSHKWQALHQQKGIGAPMVSFTMWSARGWDCRRLRILFMCTRSSEEYRSGPHKTKMWIQNPRTWNYLLLLLTLMVIHVEVELPLPPIHNPILLNRHLILFLLMIMKMRWICILFGTNSLIHKR